LYVESVSTTKRVSAGRTGADVVTVATSVAAVIKDEVEEDVAGMVNGKARLLRR